MIPNLDHSKVQSFKLQKKLHQFGIGKNTEKKVIPKCPVCNHRLFFNYFHKRFDCPKSRHGCGFTIKKEVG